MAVKFPYQNQVILTGRVVRDPEYKATQKGTTVCFFDIASNRRYKDPLSGEWKDDTTFVPMTVWGTLADRCKSRLKKGVPVYVEGRLSHSEYTNKEGNKVKRLKVVVRKIQILDSIKGDINDSSSVDKLEDSIEPEETVDISSDDEIPF